MLEKEFVLGRVWPRDPKVSEFWIPQDTPCPPKRPPLQQKHLSHADQAWEGDPNPQTLAAPGSQGDGATMQRSGQEPLP